MKYLLIIFFSYSLQAQMTPAEMFKEGDYYGVIEHTDKLKKMSNKTSFLTAQSYMALGDYSNAIRFFHRASSSYPESHYLLGQCFFGLGNWDQAFREFKQSIDLKINKEISYLYLAKVLNEKRLFSESVQILEKLIKNKTTSSDVKQSAEYLKANIFLSAYKRSRNPSTRFLKKKVLDSFQQAYQFNQTSSFAPEISNELNYLKNEYYVGLTNYFINVEQTMEYNSNVLNQATEVPLEQESASPLHVTNISGRIDYGIPFTFPIKSQNSLYLNWTKYLEEENQVAQLNNISLGFNSQNNLNPFIHSSNTPILLRLSGNYSLANNQLQGSYDYDNSMYTFGIGFNDHEESYNSDYYLTYTTSDSFQSSNKFNSFAISGFTTFRVSEGTTISLLNNLTMINFSDTPSLSTYELQNTLNYIYQVKDGHSIYTGGRLNIISPKESSSRETRGLEFLLSPTFTYEWRPSQRFYTNLAYTFSRKLSEDKTSFDYEQHLVQLKLGLYYD